MSSSSWELKEALAPSVLARIFSTCPLSEPRNTTVWFLLGPADVSTAIWRRGRCDVFGARCEAAHVSPVRSRCHVWLAVSLALLQEGTDSSISGYDLMKVSVSSGKVVDDL
ncbi:hypothetical protein F7725_017915 [Dissostichus mawsoni]|uniref:Uncharacterized protein n=1 Tax=Dissostichus mawsoni TaxID=36200 RepID=A0A7J5XSW9_DISMA|nr:hypothetical protein F7725_017915 [Dissostichus mawsoni]